VVVCADDVLVIISTKSCNVRHYMCVTL